ncbi:MAG: SRPBCC family protein [Rhodococcus sp. (in: high G+C Gram-positive bacteria)]|jgi:hypothetical protein|uniref:SRPBCC family protein n=1 Tax=Rhodococcus sp. EPR-157 TaxID=1813677 RepID=UPI0007BBBB6F|nr:SRPBCC family protein [Rhodococcus sp. EPR-157]KZF06390.1 hypothetical protein A2J03_24610 [Rhodococcus sp. EPR-157]
MARFHLQPVSDHSIFETAKYTYTYTLDLAADADTVWAGLTADQPLAWCSALKGQYTSGRPFGSGTTRNVVVARLLRLNERFFEWDESNRRHSFYVESASLPLFGVFAEDYQITPTATGCRFVWRFALEARPGLGVLLAVTQPLNKKVLLDGLVRDTIAHFGRA